MNLTALKQSVCKGEECSTMSCKVQLRPLNFLVSGTSTTSCGRSAMVKLLYQRMEKKLSLPKL